MKPRKFDLTSDRLKELLDYDAINIGGKSITIGSFPTAEAADAAYIATKRRVHAGCTL